MVWDGMGREAAGSVHVLAMYVDIFRSSSSLIYSKSYEIEKEREREREIEGGREGGTTCISIFTERNLHQPSLHPTGPLLSSTQLNSTHTGQRLPGSSGSLLWLYEPWIN